MSIDFSLLSFLAGGFNFSINNLNYVLYCYEKKVFNLAFIFLLLFQIFKKNSFYNTFYYDHNFYSYTLDRISFCYYCCLEPSLALLLSYFNVEYRISLINLIMISTSLIIILLFCCYFLVVLFEIPLRIYIKRFFNHQGNKNKDYYDKSQISILN